MTIHQLPTLSSHDGSVEFPVFYGSSDWKLPLNKLLLTDEVSGTTNSSGNLGLSGIDSDFVVLAATRTDANGLCTPFYNTSTLEWAVHITTPGANPSSVVSASVTVRVFYLPFPFET